MTAPLSVHTGGTEIPVPQNFRWPGGKRIAVLFRMAFEAWSDDHWPGVSPMGNPLKPGYPDLNARGWAEYAYRRGVFRVLDGLAHHRVKATVMVCGILAERYPHIVKQIADAGHEVAAHSYTMDMMSVYMSEEEERKNIQRNVELIRKATGQRPVGWINPRGTPSPNTARRSSHNRAGSNSSPMRKSSSTMPISAKARTPSTSPASLSPHGPIAAPATM